MIKFTNSSIEELKSSIEPEFSNVIIVVNDNFHLYNYANNLYVELNKKKNTKIIFVPEGEESKKLKTVEYLWNELIKLNSNRNTLLIGVGGGSTLDTAAFCASTYMRGIIFWSIPTTLLSMVDASIGGKTAINFRSYKNYIGTFYKADKIWIDFNFIKSLNEIELRNGWAECLKHSLINGGKSWSEIQKTNWNLTDESIAVFWTPFIMENSLIKKTIVEKDFLEKDLREVLNAGHTFAHAIESYNMVRNKFMPHGQSVAWGLLLESLVGNNVSIDEFKKYSSDHWLKILESLVITNFPVLPKLTKIDFGELYNFAEKDKKNRSNYIVGSIIKEPGKFKLQEEIDFNKIYNWMLYYNE